MINNFMIFGDSYSTHKDYIDEKYLTFYSSEIGEGEYRVHKMLPEETWWGRLIKNDGAKLVRNDSWSGSTIGYTGYAGDCSKTSSFIYRYRCLLESGFFRENNIDTLFLFGGTNDSWCNAPLGEESYSGWCEEDFFSVLPAITYFVKCLRETLPDTRLVILANCGIKSEIVECLKNTAKKYDADIVVLENVDKESDHPTVLGMEQIYEQVVKIFK